MKRYDVLIVGLGPTGITLAALLAQRGLQVAAFDKLPDLYPLPRAIGIDHEAMRLLQQLGLVEAMAPHVAPYRPSEYLGADGRLIRRLDAAPEPHPLAWAPNYVFNQPALEYALRAHVQESPHVRMQTSSEVKAFGQDEQGVWVDVMRSGETTSERVAASYLVACDGGSSPVRKQLGIRFEDLGFDEAWLVVDSIVPAEKLDALPHTQVQYCDPNGPATFVVGPGNHRRWEIMLRPEDAAVIPVPEDKIWQLLERWVKPGEITLWRSAAYRFHGLVAQQWREGRIFLAGDAAHMTPPFMAQGMMQGLRDAMNLAWKLARVLQHGAAPALLDTYQQERRPHTLQTTRTAIELGRIICERDPVKAAERDQRLRDMHAGSIPTTVRQSLIPALDAGLLDVDSPGAGRIFPQPRLALPTPGALLDDLTGSCFRLVSLDPPASAMCRPLIDALHSLQGVFVCLSPSTEPSVLAIQEAHAVIEPWMKDLGVRYALVRPDHYVYGTAVGDEDALRLLQALGEKLSACVTG